MNEPPRSITVANDESIGRLIQQAQRKLVILAPALSKKVAEILSAEWRRLGKERVSVILDLDPEVFRLGYGDFEALDLLEKTASDLGTMLQRQPGIRIGLILADDTTLVYSPTPRLIEAGPSSPQTPNAILLETPPPKLVKELGQGEHGVKEQTVGLDKAVQSDIAKVSEDLKQNPPQKFDLARTVRVFNAHFEFVEIELIGTSIERKSVPIPADPMGLVKDEQTKRLLHTNFRLVGEDECLSGADLRKEVDRIRKTFLALIPGYGHVVLRTIKPDFEKEVEVLKLKVDQFKTKVKNKLQEAMDRNREALVEGLLPSVEKNPPAYWKKHYGSSQPDTKLVKRLLEMELDKAFGPAERLIGDMKVKHVFKGVTYESLCEPKFIAAAKKALPSLENLHLEYDAAKSKQASLFDDE